MNKSALSKSLSYMQTNQPFEEHTSTDEATSLDSSLPKEHKEKATSGLTWLSHAATSLWSAAREKAASISTELVNERAAVNRPNSPRVGSSHSRYVLMLMILLLLQIIIVIVVIMIGSQRKSSSLHTRTIPSYGLDKPSLVFIPNSDVEEEEEEDDDDEDEDEDEDEDGGDVQQEERSVDNNITENEVREKDNPSKQYMYISIIIPW